jgi:plastocyanin
MTHRFGTVLLILATMLVVTACSADSADEATDAPTTAATESEAPASPSEEADESASEGAGAEEMRVRIVGSAFDPAELTVPVGTEVTWVNADSFAHTVSEGTDGQTVDDPIVDEEIAQNGSVSVTFDEPGTYDITCGIHPSMQMTVTVEG